MNKKQKREKEYRQLTWFALIVGLMFLSTGVYRVFFKNIKIGSHYLSTEIKATNGSMFILVGVILTFSGIYRIIKKKKILKQLEEIEKNQKI